MFASMKSGSSLILGYFGQKLGHQIKSKEKLVNNLEVIVLTHLDETCLKCLPLLNLGQDRNWFNWGKKIGHWARSAENTVNTLVVTFFKQSS